MQKVNYCTIVCLLAAQKCFSFATLENDFLKVKINTETEIVAAIVYIEDKNSGNILDLTSSQEEYILSPKVGNFKLENIKIEKQTSSELFLELNYSISNTICLSLKVQHRLVRDRVKVQFRFLPQYALRLDANWEIESCISNIQKIIPLNHYDRDEVIYPMQKGSNYYQALNQIYQCQVNNYYISFIVTNPYESMVEIRDQKGAFPRLSFIILPTFKPWKAYEPVGPPIASLIDEKVALDYEYEILLDSTDTKNELVAYFSPFPNGYDQVISMIFDEIPFFRWIIPPSSDARDISGQNQLIRLLQDHPKMKMCWIIIPDPITSPDALENPDYPKGQWWLAHGVHRIATKAPDEYKEWLQHLEQGQVVLGYEDKIHLGVHGYHHTPEMKFGNNWEFQTFDSLRDERTLDMIEGDLLNIGLTKKSLQFMRFPGFKFSRSVLDAMAHHDYAGFDFDLAWEINRLPLFPYYVGTKRLWAISANWEGDSPLSYEKMQYYLEKGKWVHTAGHPIFWFNYGDEVAYQVRNRIFSQAEQDYPYLGYVHFDDYLAVANELSEIRDFEYEYDPNGISISFKGELANEETIVVHPVLEDSLSGIITIDNVPISHYRIENSKLFAVLPNLIDGLHHLAIPYKVPEFFKCEKAQLQVYPNPSVAGQPVNIANVPASGEAISILNENGILIKSLKTNSNCETLIWDLTDEKLEPVSSGIYLILVNDYKSGKREIKKIAIIR